MIKGKDPITGKFTKPKESEEAELSTHVEAIPEQVMQQEQPPRSHIQWEKGDVDKQGRVWSWRAPFREMRIAVNRTRETKEVTADQTEWLLIRFGVVLARGLSAAELMRYAEEHQL